MFETLDMETILHVAQVGGRVSSNGVIVSKHFGGIPHLVLTGCHETYTFQLYPNAQWQWRLEEYALKLIIPKLGVF